MGVHRHSGAMPLPAVLLAAAHQNTVLPALIRYLGQVRHTALFTAIHSLKQVTVQVRCQPRSPMS